MRTEEEIRERLKDIEFYCLFAKEHKFEHRYIRFDEEIQTLKWVLEEKE